MIPRVDQMGHPPVPGKNYLVFCIKAKWITARTQWWPVMGAVHEDRKFFNFPKDHYHVDRRFIKSDYWAFQAVALPLSTPTPVEPVGPPVLRVRKCRRAISPFPDCSNVDQMQAALSGAQAAHDGIGWMCPHRQFPLASILADEDGIITCPLHGLQIQQADGRVPPVRKPANYSVDDLMRDIEVSRNE